MMGVGRVGKMLRYWEMGVFSGFFSEKFVNK
jgi:hypothetical protein